MQQGTRLCLPATNGSKNIIRNGKIFEGHLDHDFHTWGMDFASQDTPEVEIIMRIPSVAGKFREIFYHRDKRPEELCLTQSQILSTIDHHPQLFSRKGRPHFFLTSKGERLIVIGVYVNGDFWHTHIFDFDDSHLWRTDRKVRVFIFDQVKVRP